MATIRSNVAKVAQAQGLTTISALARRAGLSRSTVSRLWAKPMPAWVKCSTVAKLCHALDDISVGELLIYIPDDK